MDFNDFLTSELNNIKENNLYRELTILDYPAGIWVHIQNGKYLNLCSNNYLCYANHPDIIIALAISADKYGIGSTGSRLISGTSPVYHELENKIANFKKTPAALFMSCGYVANVSTIAALINEQDAVFSDELNHASIIDGIRLSRANKFIYKHNDMNHLEMLLKQHRHKYNKAMIITDTIFSMDGDRALLAETVGLKEKHDCFLMIDEAHATGILGRKGAGLAQELNLTQDIEVQMGTFSKAIGVEGAYIAGSSDLIDYLKHKSRGFVFSTAPSPAIAGAVIKSLEIIMNDFSSRTLLWANVKYFKSELIKLQKEVNIKLIEGDSPIFCIIVGNTEETIEFQKRLFDEYSIYTKAIRPPTVKTSRIRLCLSSLLTQDNLDHVIVAIKQCAKKN